MTTEQALQSVETAIRQYAAYAALPGPKPSDFERLVPVEAAAHLDEEVRYNALVMEDLTRIKNQQIGFLLAWVRKCALSEELPRDWVRDANHTVKKWLMGEDQ